MTRSLSFSVLAALGFGGAAYAQTQAQTVPNGPSTSVTQATANPELDGASTASRLAAATPQGDVADGMKVKSESGGLLGHVSAIIPSDSGKGSYVVVADLQGLATPLPYSTASAMVQNHTLVVDSSRFDKAPKVQETQTEDDTRASWEKRVDNYWKGSGESNAVRR